MKSREEVELLKAEWLEDPCWDIETTGGCEDYKDELLAFRMEVENQRRQARRLEFGMFADKIGLRENWALAAYIERLEDRIAKLEEKMNG